VTPSAGRATVVARVKVAPWNEESTVVEVAVKVLVQY